MSGSQERTAIDDDREYPQTLELAHLLAIIDNAAKVLIERGDDVDGRILQAHGAQLARGEEWPGDRVTSTWRFEGSDCKPYAIDGGRPDDDPKPGVPGPVPGGDDRRAA